jgi:TPR repeat protein
MLKFYVRGALVAVVLFSRVVAASAMPSSSTCTPQRDPQRDVDRLRVAAAKGDTDAMFKLGCSHLGSGVAAENAKAAQWFRKAADGGNTSGMVSLGLLYYGNAGVPQDESQAAAWHRKAADLGDASGMYLLGIEYWSGRGVSQDFAEAYKWLNLAATNQQGDTQKRSADARNSVAKKMPPYLIAEALKRQDAWQAAFDARKK